MNYKFAMSLPVILIASLLSINAGLSSVNQAETTVRIEAIVFNIHSGEILAAQSEKGLMIQRPIGSLAKPIVSYALISSGKPSNNVFFCRSSTPEEKSTETCWYKPGHGNLTFKQALAHSCNAWFRQWLHDADHSTTRSLMDKLGILSVDEFEGSPNINETLCGLEGKLSIPSLNCAAAFATLFNGGIILDIRNVEKETRISPIGTIKIDANALELIAAGMRECGTTGTGSSFGEILGSGSGLVKTGTAYAEVDGKLDSTQTDGWCIALYPANRPEFLVLVHQPGGSGAEAAKEAALFLKPALERVQ